MASVKPRMMNMERPFLMLTTSAIREMTSPVSFVSCLATAYNAQSLVTLVSRQSFHGAEYELDVFSGVMFVHKDNREIEAVSDFKGKIVAVQAINYWGGGQSQFFEIERQGVSPTADLKQVVITRDAKAVIKGVLDGTFDVGFVPSGQIEKYQNENGTLVSLGKCQVVAVY